VGGFFFFFISCLRINPMFVLQSKIECPYFIEKNYVMF
jgi:hypothetical protein